MIACQEQFMAALIIFAHSNGHGFLQTFAYILHCSGDLPDKMILINADFSVRKKCMGKIHVRLPHITNEILYSKPLSTIDFPKIGSKLRLCTVRKNIHNGMILWVYKNTLIFACAGIFFEFIDGKSFF